MDVYGAPPAGLSGDFYGGHPFGPLAEDLPAEGLDGPSYLYECVELPADTGKRVRGPITRWPAGALVVGADGTVAYTGPSDYALFTLYVLGVASTTDIGYGAGIGRFDLGMELGGALSGAVQLGDVVPGGSFVGGNASSLTGGVQLGDVVPAGAADGGTASSLGGNVQLGDVAAAGSIGGQITSELGGSVQLDPAVAGGLVVGVQPVSAAPAHRRLQTSTRGPRGGRRGSR